MNKKTIDLNDKNYQEVFSKNKNVLAVFSASWCGPCKMLAPLIDEISNIKDLNTIVAKVDVDSSPSLSSLLRVRAVPCIFYFKDGKPVEKLSQHASRNNIIQFIKNNE